MKPTIIIILAMIISLFMGCYAPKSRGEFPCTEPGCTGRFKTDHARRGHMKMHPKEKESKQKQINEANEAARRYMGTSNSKNGVPDLNNAPLPSSY